MKNLDITMVTKAIVLMAGMALPGVAMSGTDPQEIVNAVNELNAQNEGSLTEIKDIHQQHYDLDASDESRQEAAQRMIDDSAEAWMKKFEQRQENLFTNAPGVNWAIQMPKDVGEFDLPPAVEAMVSRNFIRSLGTFFPTDEQLQEVMDLEIINIANPFLVTNVVLPSQKYVRFQNMFDYLDPESFEEKANNLSGALRQSKLDLRTAQDYLGLITDPDFEIDIEIARKLRLGWWLSPDDQDRVSDRMVDIISMGPNANLMASILSKRLPPSELAAGGVLGGTTTATEDEKSYMEIVDDYASKRFYSKEWHEQIDQAPKSALYRELSHMLAMTHWMQMEFYKLQEQKGAVMSVLNNNSIRLYRISEYVKNFAEKEARLAAVEAEKARKEMDDQSLEGDDASTRCNPMDRDCIVQECQDEGADDVDACVDSRFFSLGGG